MTDSETALALKHKQLLIDASKWRLLVIKLQIEAAECRPMDDGMLRIVTWCSERIDLELK